MIDKRELIDRMGLEVGDQIRLIREADTGSLYAFPEPMPKLLGQMVRVTKIAPERIYANSFAFSPLSFFSSERSASEFCEFGYKEKSYFRWMGIPQPERIKDSKSEEPATAPKTLFDAAMALLNPKIGQSVKVVGTSVDEANGWGLCWTEEMNQAVGKIMTVVDVCSGRRGVYLRVDELGNGYWFPPMVLSPVTEDTVKLNSSYEAKLTKENIKVGCQTFTHDKIEELYKASRRIRGLS